MDLTGQRHDERFVLKFMSWNQEMLHISDVIPKAFYDGRRLICLTSSSLKMFFRGDMNWTWVFRLANGAPELSNPSQIPPFPHVSVLTNFFAAGYVPGEIALLARIFGVWIVEQWLLQFSKNVKIDTQHPVQLQCSFSCSPLPYLSLDDPFLAISAYSPG